jgi:poly-gamma-glutamate synthesis protein (capsule biosynthesis protein)
MSRLLSPEQRWKARRMVAAGANLILGHHPHLLQPCERIAGAPVFYRLGNFLFSEMYRRGYNSTGEHYCCRLRLHPSYRQMG